MPTISCPTCAKMLNVPVDLLGKKVKCSACQNVFTAEAESAPAGPPAEESKPEKPAPRRREEEDEDRPRRRDRDDDDDGGDRPKRRKRSGRDYAPHRGTLILTFGLLGLLVCF